MKHVLVLQSLCLGVLLAGCASRGKLVLAPVGPPPRSPNNSGSNAKGYLVVYSALSSTPPTTSALYRANYSGYRILARGTEQLVQEISNNSSKPLDAPARIELPVGHYEVLAHANGYGLVTVPVVIKAGQITIVHLEGSNWWPMSSPIFESNPVRLPHGQIVGWRATDADSK